MLVDLSLYLVGFEVVDLAYLHSGGNILAKYNIQKTGGQWIYVMDKDGKGATKRKIKIGRQNPQYFEVLEGLNPGEKVITSSYDNYGDSDVLVF